MSRQFQVVIDCHDPDRMAAFWSAALGYRVDPVPDGYDNWMEYQIGQGYAENERVRFAAVHNPQGPERLCFLGVPESKTVKNRLHLDIQATLPDDSPARNIERVDTLVAELRRLGGTAQRTGRERGQYFVTMTDVEGNEFCVH
ncbi:VOC family protein [Nocardia flavorosea]|uniref:VOC family protein n=1 Tax=Nocardia flavorosea TaxID=53429 RepID=A0A846YLR3_9NOCA|nr:VOC family protein [Nocardia flavorosea]NKY59945.1 VOC family protein [Nocardia flavorosea]